MKRQFLWFFIIAAFVFISSIVDLIIIYTDWLWFSSVEYQDVFLKILFTRIKLGVGFGLVFLIIMIVNLLLADRLSRVGFIRMGNDSIELPGLNILGPNIKQIMIIASVFLSLIIGIEASSRWDIFLKFSNSIPFGYNDPVFNNDISFYIFEIPFLNYIYQWSLIAIVFSFMISTGVYVYKKGIIITNNGIQVRASTYGHLSILLGLFIIIRSFGYRLLAFNLLTTQRNFVSGAGYADIHARLPLLGFLVAISLIIGIALFANVYFKSWKLPAGGILILILASGFSAAYPEIIQKLRVLPNEISLEKEYINRQIEFTRKAYDLDRVKVTPFEAEKEITAGQIKNNETTINNVRLWDSRPLLQTYRQLQEIRTYYSFYDVDVDRYNIDGYYRQVTISTRELSYDKLPAKIWINEHLSFTHGYGVCMSPVNKFTQEGLPEFIIKDIPPVHMSEIKVERPQIYYGELANDYVFTNTDADEFDYPLGDGNVFSDYQGTGGVKLDAFFKKAAFALRFSSLAALLNTDIKKDSRIMIYRNILGYASEKGRASRIMPLIHYDVDPYIFIDDEGKLKWIIDGYTISSSFPYSHHIQAGSSFNYIRNSVKVIIDAYDGSVDFYIFDNNDPIIQSYSKIFPGLFKPKETMPDSYKKHTRYPVDLFRIQSQIYTAYQMTDPVVFYNKEDLWEYPRELFYQNEQNVEPYFTIMKLPGNISEEYILMLPFTPANKDNISAWMCVRNDDEHYGELLVYKFPKKKLIYGPFQIEARVDQDPEISKQLSLWSQGGSQIIRGNMLVIPIENSIMYVEPLFLKAEKGDIPELKRVIVSIDDRVVMEETLEDALSILLRDYEISDKAIDTATQTIESDDSIPESEKSLLIKSLNHIKEAKIKIKELDWEGFGKELDAAEQTLDRAVNTE